MANQPVSMQKIRWRLVIVNQPVGFYKMLVYSVVMRDSQCSRHRLLEAATAEFAALGISGARVDRIAEAADVNKSQMYSYFGSKEGLFDAVFQEQLEAIVDAVPLTAEDLPSYAVRLYDSYIENPELLRLATWYRLERLPKGDLLASVGDEVNRKLQAIADAQREGLVDPGITPAEVFSLVTAIAMTWSPVNVTYSASRDDEEYEHARRRSVIAEVVSRALLCSDHKDGIVAETGTGKLAQP